MTDDSFEIISRSPSLGFSFGLVAIRIMPVVKITCSDFDELPGCFVHFYSYCLNQYFECFNTS